MEQLTMDLEALEDIYMECENEDHKKIIKFNLVQDIKNGLISITTHRDKLIDWFCNRFFNFDLEISCNDLFEIAINSGLKLI